MSDENKTKEKTFEFPMMPIYGLDLGRELGSIDARLNQLESDNREIKRDIKELDAKFAAMVGELDAKLTAMIGDGDARLTDKIEAVDGRVDKCLMAINRLDERTKNLSMATWGGMVVLLIAIIAQKFL